MRFESVVFLIFPLVLISCVCSTFAGSTPTSPATNVNSVTLGWTRSPDSNTLGYVVFYGLSSGVYTNQVNVGNTNWALIGGLLTGLTYYSTVVAYGSNGSTSPPSNEIQFSMPAVFLPTVKPVITNVLVSADSQCQALMPDLTSTNYTLASATCGNSMVLTQNPAGGTVLSLGSNLVVLILTDGCGNTVSATNLVTVQDTTPPVLAGLPATTASYQCRQDVPAAPTVTAVDGCDGPVSVSYLQSESYQGSSCSNIITRTWTTTDSSGNTASFAQTIIVNDTTPPVLVKGTISPWYATQTAAEAAALTATGMSDNCTPTGQLITTVNTVGTSNALITVNVADGCGNTASVTYNTQIDNRPPVLQLLAGLDGMLLLTWNAVPFQNYQVQYTTNCIQSIWTNLGGAILATNTLGNASDSNFSATCRFYRLVVLP